tara:strand:- start:9005 stop:11224 length:2220 start_codon:yes stop_codon:yes gene_type:complete
MKKILFIILFIFTTANAAEITKLEVIGNDRVSKETIKVYGDIKIPKNYNTNDINLIIKNLYETGFFENINIKLQNNTLIVNVKEYKVINEIIIKGEKTKKYKEAMLELISSKKNGPYTKNKINNDVDIIKKLYSSIGFNFSEVTVREEDLGLNRINLYFVLERGERSKIKKISFIGDKKIRDRRLRDIIVSEEYKFWKFITKNVYLAKQNIDLDKRLLSNYYKSIGYYDVQVLSNNIELVGSDIEVNFTINAGTRYKFVKFETEVSPTFDKELFSKIQKDYKKNIGEYYSPFKVKKILDNLDLIIASNNLQFVEHSVSETLVGDGIQVKVNIKEGKKETVERINIKGNSVTNENVIRSELLLDEGDPFNNLKLEQSLAKLKARNIFGIVESNVSKGSEEDLKIIDISVEEKPTGEISAGAGVGTEGASFAFNVTENNFLGNGIKFITSFNVSEESLKGQIQVNNPNFNYSGNALNLRISSLTNDKPDSGYENSAITLGAGTKFEQYKDIFIAPNINLNSDKLTVQDTASSNLKKQAGTFTDLTLSYQISSDKRDRAFMPTSGYLTSFSQELPIYADSPFIRNSFGSNIYRSLTEDIIGSAKFFVSGIHGLDDKDVRLSKRQNLSTSRLRGFESGKIGPKDGNDYVGGNYLASLSLETTFPNLLPESSKIDVGAFLDMGNVWHVDYSDEIDDSNKIRSSVGINTSWISPVGPMSFIFAQNISKASTDITEGFNFRLGTTF